MNDLGEQSGDLVFVVDDPFIVVPDLGAVEVIDVKSELVDCAVLDVVFDIEVDTFGDVVVVNSIASVVNSVFSAAVEDIGVITVDTVFEVVVNFAVDIVGAVVGAVVETFDAVADAELVADTELLVVFDASFDASFDTVVVVVNVVGELFDELIISCGVVDVKVACDEVIDTYVGLRVDVVVEDFGSRVVNIVVDGLLAVVVDTIVGGTIVWVMADDVSKAVFVGVVDSADVDLLIEAVL